MQLVCLCDTQIISQLLQFYQLYQQYINNFLRQQFTDETELFLEISLNTIKTKMLIEQQESTKDSTMTMTRRKKKQLTKQDVFASPETASSNSPSPDQVPAPEPLRQSQIAKYLSPDQQEQEDSNQRAAESLTTMAVVGQFDELNGVITPDQCKKMQKAVKIVSLQEAANQAQAEKEALLQDMPEDAVLFQGIPPEGVRTASNTSHIRVNSDQSTSEDYQVMTTRESTEETSFDQSKVESNRGLIDPSLVAQYNQSRTQSQKQEHQQTAVKSNQPPQQHIRFQQHLPPIFERSFEQSDNASSFGPNTTSNEFLNNLSSQQRSQTISGQQQCYSGELGVSSSQLMQQQQQYQQMLQKSGRHVSYDSSKRNHNDGSTFQYGEQSNDSMGISTPMMQQSLKEAAAHAGGSQQQPLLNQSDHNLFNAGQSSDLILSSGNGQNEALLSGDFDAEGLEDAEKWPVTQKQAVIVVTRTYQEEKARERRRRIVAAGCLLLLIAWLIWALVLTL